MRDTDRNEEIARLREQLSETQAKRAALIAELIHLAARLPEIRREFGNPFCYSHPEEPDEGIAHYTGNSSHEVGLPTSSELRRVDRELARINEALRRLEQT